MKSNWYYIIVLFLFVSCNGQQKGNSNTIDASKVKEITISNHMYCTLQKLKKEDLVIKDRDQIEKIVNAFKSSTERDKAVNTSMHYGSFVLSFNEGEIHHYYSIVYTVYEGVILSNDNNGDVFKNDRLEGAVYPLFIDK